MKHLKLFALILLTVGCAQKELEEGKFRLIGHVTGMTDGELYLMEYPEADTIKVKNGRFEIERKIDDISSRFLTKDQNTQSIESLVRLYLEPAVMEINIDVNDLKNARLTGSETQDDSYKLNALQEVLREKYKTELDALAKAGEKYNEARKNKASDEVLEAIKEEDFIARGNLEPYFKESRDISLNFTKNNPNSYISLENMRFLLGGMKFDEAKKLFNSLDGSLTTSEEGQKIENDINKMKFGMPGTVAADFASTDIHGNSLKLADFRGKYLLIDFWASWCVPCRKGNPHLLKLYANYQPEGFEILGIASDDGKEEAWHKAVKKDEIGVWHHILSGFSFNRETGEMKKGIGDKYNVHTLPTKILIDPQGLIIGRYGDAIGESDESMDKKLEDIFGI